MKKRLSKTFSVLMIGLSTLTSCVTSSPSLCEAPNANLQKYHYVVLDNDITCPKELDGTILQIQKEISSSLNIISSHLADSLAGSGVPILYNSIYVGKNNNLTQHDDKSLINLYFQDYSTKDNKLIIKCNPRGNFFLRQLQSDLKAAFRWR